MVLIIAEKPSLARNIVAGIQSDGQHHLSSRRSFFEGDGYLVTWAFGHLFSLEDIEYYNPSPNNTNHWTMDNLPCFPEQFHFSLRKDASQRNSDDGVKRQYEVIESLCNRADVDTIVNAGDADREGEIIVRLCVSHALKSQKTQKRLWLPDQTPQTVQAALAALKEAEQYDLLANEGFARTYVDWLYGVNLTRFATIKTGTLLRVGRVIVPIVKAIYDRDMAIKHFVPDLYYSLSSKAETKGETVELNSQRKFEKNKLDLAKKTAEDYNFGGAVVTKVKKKKDVVGAGKLYSLSKLQNVLGKKYKMPMDVSLSIVQKLYEAGYVTYPRTNSEYLATAEKDKIEKILENVSKIGYPVTFKDSKTIFDDSKIESHSALTPTYKIPNKQQLPEMEMQVYSTIFRRFVAVFCAKDCVADKTEITIDVAGGSDQGGETFTLKGMIIRDPGWTKYDDSTQRDRTLPPLEKGDTVNIAFAPVEKETSPPKHYTIETLNNYLKNPFKEDKAKAAQAQKEKAAQSQTIEESEEETDDTEDYRAIFEGLELGTEATRTGIIDNARKSQYIQLKKDVYTILPDGIFLMEALGRMGIIMDKYKTSQLGQSLKKVFHGECAVEDAVALAKAEISEVFDQSKRLSPPETDTDMGAFGDKFGPCPICHEGEVRRTKFGYGCSRWKEGCKFTVNGIICQRVISAANVKLLLEQGKTAKITGFTSKNGKLFDATLLLQSDGKITFDFN